MQDYLSPERHRIALLTIDAQRDFMSPQSPACVGGAMAAIPQIERLVAAFRKLHAPIVHMVRLYRCNGSNVDLCNRAWVEAGGRVAMPGALGAELIDALKTDPGMRLQPDLLFEGRMQQAGPGSCEWICYKPRLSAFFKTPLEAHLQAAGITTVVICGADFPASPRATAYDAINRDLRIVLAVDAITGASDAAFDELAPLGVNLMSSAKLLEWLADSREAA